MLVASPSKVAVLLAERRRELGLSQEAVTKSAGISRVALSKIETGATESPSFRTVCDLCRVLGLTSKDLRDAGVFN